jgi:hypothetical protein
MSLLGTLRMAGPGRKLPVLWLAASICAKMARRAAAVGTWMKQRQQIGREQPPAWETSQHLPPIDLPRWRFFSPFSDSLGKWPGIAVLAFGFALLLFSRDPGHLLNAAFWAEDGWLWYPDAYNDGLRSVLSPVVGYLQTLSRIGGLIAQIVPLAWAPTLFAAIAFVFQLLPAVFLVSDRMATAWPDPWSRLLFALVYIALPNAFEVYVNLTNAQWFLAILAFLILVSRPPRHWTAKSLDLAALLLSGLSGVFGVFLLPIAMWQTIATRARFNLWRCCVVAAAVLIQGCCLLYTIQERSAAPLGAGVVALSRIVTLQIMFGALFGQHSMGWLVASSFWQSDAVAMTVAAAGLAMGGIAFARGSALLRKGCLFAGLLFAAALLSPQVSATDPQWPVMSLQGMGDRYYVIPMLAWIGVLFTLAADSNPLLRPLGMVLLLVLLWEIPGDWRYPYMPDTKFAAHAQVFDAAPAGTTMRLAIHPPGTEMTLVKR